jgi:hypothetical protein
MAFELADKFGHTSPFKFTQQDNLVDVNRLQQSFDAHLRIIFVESDNIGNGIFKVDDNDFLVIARKNKETEQSQYQTNDFRTTGLTHYNISKLYQVVLGKNIIASLEKNKDLAKDYVVQFLEWVGVPKGERYTTFQTTLLSMTLSFVKNYQSYQPTAQVQELFAFFTLLLELGFIDLSESAQDFAEGVFDQFAKAIRAQKLGEPYWNPNYDGGYTPLFNSLKETAEVERILDQLISTPESNLPENNNFTDEDYEKLSTLPTSLAEIMLKMVKYFKHFIINNIRYIVEKTDQGIKLYNAYTVGFIDGLIKFFAQVVEAFGFLLKLLNYNTQKELIDSIVFFVNNMNWESIKHSIRKALKELFKFMDGETIYESAYEFGKFIPTLFGLILDLFYIAKGAKKVAKSIPQFTKDLKANLRNANNSIKAFENAIKLKNISKLTLKDLKAKGISIDVRLLPEGQFNMGVPTKFFDGKKITVRYNDIILDEFFDEKKADDYLRKLNKDKKFFDAEVSRSQRKFLFNKWLSKFDRSFLNHISGDVALEKIRIVFVDVFYLGTKGQGGHYVNKFLKIDEITIPPGLKNIDDIADDVPFKARVTIQTEQGRAFSKSAKSSIFPKNWSVERIQQEVAWVYENTVAKGVNKRPRQPNDLFNKYDGLSTSGFKIRVEVDDIGNIMNAYPIIE